MARRRTLVERNMAQPTIQSPQISKKLIQALDIHGKVASPTLGDLIHPVVIVEDVSRDSWYTLTADLPCAGVVEQGGGVGETAIAQLFNGSNSTIAIVDKIYLAPSGTTAYFVFTETAARGAPIIGFARFRDTRITGVPSCFVCSDHPVGVPGVTNPVAVANGGTVSVQVLEPSYVLNPGQGITVLALTLNLVASRVSFQWRERTP